MQKAVGRVMKMLLPIEEVHGVLYMDYIYNGAPRVTV
jgi:hypothetical protein